MLKIEDAVRVISKNGKKYFHLCKDCGKEIGPNSRSALKTRTGYCNRCHKQRQHHPGKSLLRRIKDSARNRTTVTMTEDEVAELRKVGVCHYCGGEVKWVQGRINLDRKDSNIGYQMNNVVICCFDCNRIKTNLLSYDEMRVVAHTIRLFRNFSPEDQKEFEFSLISLLSDQQVEKNGRVAP